MVQKALAGKIRLRLKKLTVHISILQDHYMHYAWVCSCFKLVTAIHYIVILL